MNDKTNKTVLEKQRLTSENENLTEKLEKEYADSFVESLLANSFVPTKQKKQLEQWQSSSHQERRAKGTFIFLKEVLIPLFGYENAIKVLLAYEPTSFVGKFSDYQNPKVLEKELPLWDFLGSSFDVKTANLSAFKKSEKRIVENFLCNENGEVQDVLFIKNADRFRYTVLDTKIQEDALSLSIEELEQLKKERNELAEEFHQWYGEPIKKLTRPEFLHHRQEKFYVNFQSPDTWTELGKQLDSSKVEDFKKIQAKWFGDKKTGIPETKFYAQSPVNAQLKILALLKEEQKQLDLLKKDCEIVFKDDLSLSNVKGEQLKLRTQLKNEIEEGIKNTQQRIDETRKEIFGALIHRLQNWPKHTDGVLAFAEELGALFSPVPDWLVEMRKIAMREELSEDQLQECITEIRAYILALGDDPIVDFFKEQLKNISIWPKNKKGEPIVQDFQDDELSETLWNNTTLWNVVNKLDSTIETLENLNIDQPFDVLAENLNGANQMLLDGRSSMLINIEELEEDFTITPTFSEMFKQVKEKITEEKLEKLEKGIKNTKNKIDAKIKQIQNDLLFSEIPKQLNDKEKIKWFKEKIKQLKAVDESSVDIVTLLLQSLRDNTVTPESIDRLIELIKLGIVPYKTERIKELKAIKDFLFEGFEEYPDRQSLRNILEPLCWTETENVLNALEQNLLSRYQYNDNNPSQLLELENIAQSLITLDRKLKINAFEFDSNPEEYNDSIIELLSKTDLLLARDERTGFWSMVVLDEMGEVVWIDLTEAEDLREEFDLGEVLPIQGLNLSCGKALSQFLNNKTLKDIQDKNGNLNADLIEILSSSNYPSVFDLSHENFLTWDKKAFISDKNALCWKELDHLYQLYTETESSVISKVLYRIQQEIIKAGCSFIVNGTLTSEQLDRYDELFTELFPYPLSDYLLESIVGFSRKLAEDNNAEQLEIYLPLCLQYKDQIDEKTWLELKDALDNAVRFCETEEEFNALWSIIPDEFKEQDMLQAEKSYQKLSSEENQEAIKYLTKFGADYPDFMVKAAKEKRILNVQQLIKDFLKNKNIDIGRVRGCFEQYAALEEILQISQQEIDSLLKEASSVEINHFLNNITQLQYQLEESDDKFLRPILHALSEKADLMFQQKVLEGVIEKLSESKGNFDFLQDSRVKNIVLNAISGVINELKFLVKNDELKSHLIFLEALYNSIEKNELTQEDAQKWTKLWPQLFSTEKKTLSETALKQHNQIKQYITYVEELNDPVNPQLSEIIRDLKEHQSLIEKYNVNLNKDSFLVSPESFEILQERLEANFSLERRIKEIQLFIFNNKDRKDEPFLSLSQAMVLKALRKLLHDICENPEEEITPQNIDAKILKAQTTIAMCGTMAQFLSETDFVSMSGEFDITQDRVIRELSDLLEMKSEFEEVDVNSPKDLFQKEIAIQLELDETKELLEKHRDTKENIVDQRIALSDIQAQQKKLKILINNIFNEEDKQKLTRLLKELNKLENKVQGYLEHLKIEISLARSKIKIEEEEEKEYSVENFLGYSSVLMLESQPDENFKPEPGQLAVFQDKRKLIVYWEEGANKSFYFGEYGIKDILLSLPKPGEKSTNNTLINNIISKYGCTQKELTDWQIRQIRRRNNQEKSEEELKEYVESLQTEWDNEEHIKLDDIGLKPKNGRENPIAYFFGVLNDIANDTIARLHIKTLLDTPDSDAQYKGMFFLDGLDRFDKYAQEVRDLAEIYKHHSDIVTGIKAYKDGYGSVETQYLSDTQESIKKCQNKLQEFLGLNKPISYLQWGSDETWFEWAKHGIGDLLLGTEHELTDPNQPLTKQAKNYVKMMLKDKVFGARLKNRLMLESFKKYLEKNSTITAPILVKDQDGIVWVYGNDGTLTKAERKELYEGLKFTTTPQSVSNPNIHTAMIFHSKVDYGVYSKETTQQLINLNEDLLKGKINFTSQFENMGDKWAREIQANINQQWRAFKEEVSSFFLSERKITTYVTKEVFKAALTKGLPKIGRWVGNTIPGLGKWGGGWLLEKLGTIPGGVLTYTGWLNATSKQDLDRLDAKMQFASRKTSYDAKMGKYSLINGEALEKKKKEFLIEGIGATCEYYGQSITNRITDAVNDFYKGWEGPKYLKGQTARERFDSQILNLEEAASKRNKNTGLYDENAKAKLRVLKDIRTRGDQIPPLLNELEKLYKELRDYFRKNNEQDAEKCLELLLKIEQQTNKIKKVVPSQFEPSILGKKSEATEMLEGPLDAWKKLLTPDGGESGSKLKNFEKTHENIACVKEALKTNFKNGRLANKYHMLLSKDWQKSICTSGKLRHIREVLVKGVVQSAMGNVKSILTKHRGKGNLLLKGAIKFPLQFPLGVINFASLGLSLIGVTLPVTIPVITIATTLSYAADYMVDPVMDYIWPTSTWKVIMEKQNELITEERTLSTVLLDAWSTVTTQDTDKENEESKKDKKKLQFIALDRMINWRDYQITSKKPPKEDRYSLAGLFNSKEGALSKYRVINYVLTLEREPDTNFVLSPDYLAVLKEGDKFIVYWSESGKIKNKSLPKDFIKNNELPEVDNISSNNDLINKILSTIEINNVLMLKEEPAEDFILQSGSLAVFRQNKKLIVYWNENGKIKNKSLPEDSIKSKLPEVGHNSSENSLINEIISTYKIETPQFKENLEKELLTPDELKKEYKIWTDTGLFEPNGPIGIFAHSFDAFTEWEEKNIKPSRKNLLLSDKQASALKKIEDEIKEHQLKILEQDTSLKDAKELLRDKINPLLDERAKIQRALDAREKLVNLFDEGLGVGSDKRRKGLAFGLAELFVKTVLGQDLKKQTKESGDIFSFLVGKLTELKNFVVGEDELTKLQKDPASLFDEDAKEKFPNLYNKYEETLNNLKEVFEEFKEPNSLCPTELLHEKLKNLVELEKKADEALKAFKEKGYDLQTVSKLYAWISQEQMDFRKEASEIFHKKWKESQNEINQKRSEVVSELIKRYSSGNIFEDPFKRLSEKIGMKEISQSLENLSDKEPTEKDIQQTAETIINEISLLEKRGGDVKPLVEQLKRSGWPKDSKGDPILAIPKDKAELELFFNARLWSFIEWFKRFEESKKSKSLIEQLKQTKRIAVNMEKHLSGLSKDMIEMEMTRYIKKYINEDNLLKLRNEEKELSEAVLDEYRQNIKKWVDDGCNPEERAQLIEQAKVLKKLEIQVPLTPEKAAFEFNEFSFSNLFNKEGGLVGLDKPIWEKLKTIGFPVGKSIVEFRDHNTPEGKELQDLYNEFDKIRILAKKELLKYAQEKDTTNLEKYSDILRETLFWIEPPKRDEKQTWGGNFIKNAYVLTPLIQKILLKDFMDSSDVESLKYYMSEMQKGITDEKYQEFILIKKWRAQLRERMEEFLAGDLDKSLSQLGPLLQFFNEDSEVYEILKDFLSKCNGEQFEKIRLSPLPEKIQKEFENWMTIINNLDSSINITRNQAFISAFEKGISAPKWLLEIAESKLDSLIEEVKTLIIDGKQNEPIRAGLLDFLFAVDHEKYPLQLKNAQERIKGIYLDLIRDSEQIDQLDRLENQWGNITLPEEIYNELWKSRTAFALHIIRTKPTVKDLDEVFSVFNRVGKRAAPKVEMEKVQKALQNYLKDLEPLQLKQILEESKYIPELWKKDALSKIKAWEELQKPSEVLLQHDKVRSKDLIKYLTELQGSDYPAFVSFADKLIVYMDNMVHSFLTPDFKWEELQKVLDPNFDAGDLSNEMRENAEANRIKAGDILYFLLNNKMPDNSKLAALQEQVLRNIKLDIEKYSESQLLDLWEKLPNSPLIHDLIRRISVRTDKYYELLENGKEFRDQMEKLKKGSFSNESVLAFVKLLNNLKLPKKSTDRELITRKISLEINILTQQFEQTLDRVMQGNKEGQFEPTHVQTLLRQLMVLKQLHALNTSEFGKDLLKKTATAFYHAAKQSPNFLDLLLYGNVAKTLYDSLPEVADNEELDRKSFLHLFDVAFVPTLLEVFEGPLKEEQKHFLKLKADILKTGDLTRKEWDKDFPTFKENFSKELEKQKLETEELLKDKKLVTNKDTMDQIVKSLENSILEKNQNAVEKKTKVTESEEKILQLKNKQKKLEEKRIKLSAEISEKDNFRTIALAKVKIKNNLITVENRLKDIKIWEEKNNPILLELTNSLEDLNKNLERRKELVEQYKNSKKFREEAIKWLEEDLTYPEDLSVKADKFHAEVIRLQNEEKFLKEQKNEWIEQKTLLEKEKKGYENATLPWLWTTQLKEVSSKLDEINLLLDNQEKKLKDIEDKLYNTKDLLDKTNRQQERRKEIRENLKKETEGLEGGFTEYLEINPEAISKDMAKKAEEKSNLEKEQEANIRERKALLDKKEKFEKDFGAYSGGGVFNQLLENERKLSSVESALLAEENALPVIQEIYDKQESIAKNWEKKLQQLLNMPRETEEEIKNFVLAVSALNDKDKKSIFGESLEKDTNVSSLLQKASEWTELYKNWQQLNIEIANLKKENIAGAIELVEQSHIEKLPIHLQIEFGGYKMSVYLQKVIAQMTKGGTLQQKFVWENINSLPKEIRKFIIDRLPLSDIEKKEKQKIFAREDYIDAIKNADTKEQLEKLLSSDYIKENLPEDTFIPAEAVKILNSRIDLAIKNKNVAELSVLLSFFERDVATSSDDVKQCREKLTEWLIKSLYGKSEEELKKALPMLSQYLSYYAGETKQLNKILTEFLQSLDVSALSLVIDGKTIPKSWACYQLADRRLEAYRWILAEGWTKPDPRDENQSPRSLKTHKTSREELTERLTRLLDRQPFFKNLAEGEEIKTLLKALKDSVTEIKQGGSALQDSQYSSEELRYFLLISNFSQKEHPSLWKLQVEAKEDIRKEIVRLVGSTRKTSTEEKEKVKNLSNKLGLLEKLPPGLEKEVGELYNIVAKDIYALVNPSIFLKIKKLRGNVEKISSEQINQLLKDLTSLELPENKEKKDLVLRQLKLDMDYFSAQFVKTLNDTMGAKESHFKEQKETLSGLLKVLTAFRDLIHDDSISLEPEFEGILKNSLLQFANALYLAAKEDAGFIDLFDEPEVIEQLYNILPEKATHKGELTKEDFIYIFKSSLVKHFVNIFNPKPLTKEQIDLINKVFNLLSQKLKTEEEFQKELNDIKRLGPFKRNFIDALDQQINQHKKKLENTKLNVTLIGAKYRNNVEVHIKNIESEISDFDKELQKLNESINSDEEKRNGFFKVINEPNLDVNKDKILKKLEDERLKEDKIVQKYKEPLEKIEQYENVKNALSEPDLEVCIRDVEDILKYEETRYFNKATVSQIQKELEELKSEEALKNQLKNNPTWLIKMKERYAKEIKAQENEKILSDKILKINGYFELGLSVKENKQKKQNITTQKEKSIQTQKKWENKSKASLDKKGDDLFLSFDREDLEKLPEYRKEIEEFQVLTNDLEILEEEKTQANNATNLKDVITRVDKKGFPVGVEDKHVNAIEDSGLKEDVKRLQRFFGFNKTVDTLVETAIIKDVHEIDKEQVLENIEKLDKGSQYLIIEQTGIKAKLDIYEKLKLTAKRKISTSSEEKGNEEKEEELQEVKMEKDEGSEKYVDGGDDANKSINYDEDDSFMMDEELEKLERKNSTSSNSSTSSVSSFKKKN